MSEPKPLLAPLKPALVPARLWTSNGFVPDTWVAIAADQPLPSSGNVLMSLDVWRKSHVTPTADARRYGVQIANSDTIDPNTDQISRLQLIALSFPKFSDGRAYSTARRLREQGFAREIRAVGDVLLDQIPLMLRCGFDAFEIMHVPTLAALDAGHLPAIANIYQSAAERAGSNWSLRRQSDSTQAA